MMDVGEEKRAKIGNCQTCVREGIEAMVGAGTLDTKTWRIVESAPKTQGGVWAKVMYNRMRHVCRVRVGGRRRCCH